MDALLQFGSIYSGQGKTPEGFSGKMIVLDAGEHSLLKWDLGSLETSIPILWFLDIGLTEEIWTDEARFLALELALDHFTNTIWPSFASYSIGIALYKGPYVEALIEPLKLLAAHLPQEAKIFVFLDTDVFSTPAEFFNACHPAHLGCLIPILKGKWAEAFPYALPFLAWDHGQSPQGCVSETLTALLPKKNISLGVLLPEAGDFAIPEALFRVLPETLLTESWQGIDQLIVVASAVTPTCKRKLLGFAAAGGEVWTIGNLLSLPFEKKCPLAFQILSK